MFAATPYPHDTGLVRMSFGDLPEELAAAEKEGKIFTIYFWQEGCPYCGKLEKETLAAPEVRKIIGESYYVIEVNIFGAREITSFEGGAIDEKTLASRNNIQFTPTIVFFDRRGGEVFRLAGFWEAPYFLAAANYVKDGHYKYAAFEEFVRHVWPRREGASGKAPASRADPYSTGLVAKRSDDLREELKKAADEGKLLLIYFWSEDSPYCEIFEKDILSREKTRAAVAEGYRMIAVDIFGGGEVADFTGEKIAQRRFASNMGIQQAPTLVFIGANGEEIFRMPAVWKETAHFEAATRYVREGHYKKSSFQEFIRYVWYKPRDQQGE